MRRSSKALLTLAPSLLLALTAHARVGRDEVAHAASVQTSLTATREEVHQALLQALSEWKIRIDSPDEGLVKTEWVVRPKQDVTYRGRIVADYHQDGYQVLLSIKHEKQLKQSELRPTLGGPAASWMDVDGDYDVARAVATSVERSFGQEEDEVKIGQAPRTSARPVEVWDCFVSPSAAQRIIDLKNQRRDLVSEVKAMDQKILSAIYDGKVADVQQDVDRTKARKAEMESKITAIDREILQLVIAD